MEHCHCLIHSAGIADKKVGIPVSQMKWERKASLFKPEMAFGTVGVVAHHRTPKVGLVLPVKVAQIASISVQPHHGHHKPLPQPPRTAM